MELRIGSKFKFVYRDEPKKKKNGPIGPFGDPGGPFLSTGPLIFLKFFFEIQIFQFFFM